MRYTLFLLNMVTPNYNKLSRAWVGGFLPSSSTTARVPSSPPTTNTDHRTIQNAIQRALPLLFEDTTAVPFICRYRSDVIHPLSTKQVHQLSATVQKYESLSNLRNKILDKLQQINNKSEDHSRIIHRVETSISKSELDDIYLPYKPQSKGSLEDRINDEYPQLVKKVDEVWNNKTLLNDKKFNMKQLQPLDKATILLANRIAGDITVMDNLLEYCRRYCRVQVKQSNAASGDSKKKKAKGGGSSSSSFETYHDYSNKVNSLRDHQVLAIRRGVDQKQLKLSFDIDEERIDRIIEQTVFSTKQNHPLYINARKDAWSRLLKKRVTSRLWRDVSKRAEEQSIHVFCDNLSKALLAPPPTLIVKEQKALLALDPGFQAGIKCAILSTEGGKVMSLDTIKFLGSAQETGRKKLLSLLDQVKTTTTHGKKSKVLAVLGNGHGTREARSLLQEAASEGNIELDVKLVTEAGASVWSVTPGAKEEFPEESPAAIAAVSIGRRYLNPLNELVKIPPKSLGLGMYQHDLSEKILDEKLSLTSIDAVAEVGVELNTCSGEILAKVPSLTSKLCEKIIKARPLKSRSDLLKISGLGKQTYKNCAAFVRVSSGSGGSEALDATLVHPESYDLARWLLKELQWNLSDASSIKVTPNKQQKEVWSVIANKASNTFDVTPDRCLTVIDHLFFSITSPDPRLRESAEKKTVPLGSATGCSSLPHDASTIDKLRESQLPLRNILATVRNVVDFGAFVDFGLEQNGLLHRSKMGNIQNTSLMVGQEIGIDILGVAGTNKISVGLAGLELPADNRDNNKKRQLKPAAAKKSSGKKLRSGK